MFQFLLGALSVVDGLVVIILVRPLLCGPLCATCVMKCSLYTAVVCGCGVFGVCVVMFRLVSWFECRLSFRCGWFWTNYSSVGDVVSPALSPFLLAGVALRLVWLCGWC